MGLEKSNRPHFAFVATGSGAFAHEIVLVLGLLQGANAGLAVVRDGDWINTVSVERVTKPRRVPSPWPRERVLAMYSELQGRRPPRGVPTDMLWAVVSFKLRRLGEGGLV